LAGRASWAAKRRRLAHGGRRAVHRLIGNGSDLLGLNPLYDQIILGVILLIAVGTDAWSRQRTT
jgi:hypothetical protein